MSRKAGIKIKRVFKKMDYVNPLSHALRVKRIGQGLTQKELATNIGTTQQTISNFERADGCQLPNSSRLREYAKELGFKKFNDFIRFVNENSEPTLKKN